jgi:CRP/FNR family transcriptional regulator, cyclic AMP receptor protein
MDRLDLLRIVPIFTELDDKVLKKIVDIGLERKYTKNSIVFLEEEIGAVLFIIISGKVKIVRTDDEGKEVILSILGTGDFFGEMALLDGLPRSATVVALDKTELFIIHRREFLELMDTSPQIATSLMNELTRRLRKANEQIEDLSLKDAVGRVASVIIRLADDVGKIRKGEVVIEDFPVQQDLANMAGTSRETISRTIHQFMRHEYVEQKGNTLIIKDYDKFKSLFS